MKTQVLVVGAGPSGSTCAFFLAQQGVDVLLVDKEQWPRDKVCGDGQVFHSWGIYEEMGILEEAKEAGHILHGVTVSGVNEKLIHFVTEQPFCMGTRRYVIDDIIRRGALRGGAKFLENFEVLDLIYKRGRVVGVKALNNGVETEVYADLVILANGSHSMQARELGIYNEDPDTLWMGARGYYENVRGMDNTIELHYPFEDIYPGGYMWVFPEGEGVANVGVFVTSKALRESGGRVEDYFDRWRDTTKIGQERLGEARLLGDIKGWRLPSCWQLGKLYAKGCLTIGDAGCMIEPFMGEGFFEAMSSGKAAGLYFGKALLDGVELTDEVFETFQQMLAKEINPFYTIMGTTRKMCVSDPAFLVGFSEYMEMTEEEQQKLDPETLKWYSFFRFAMLGDGESIAKLLGGAL